MTKSTLNQKKCPKKTDNSLKRILMAGIFVLILAGLSCSIWYALPQITGEESSPSMICVGYIPFLLIFVVWIYSMFLVYKDAPRRGLNENFWLLVFILNVPGIVIYLVLAWNKPIGKPTRPKRCIKPRDKSNRSD